MNEIEVLNRGAFLRLNGEESSPRWLIDVAIGIGDDLIYLVPVVLIGLWLWGSSVQRTGVIKSGVNSLFALGMNQLIGLVWRHPRPFMIDLGHTWMSHAPDSSFPSDHATVFACVGITLLLDGAALLGSCILFAGFFVAWARVFLGLHFPFDIVGAVGVACVAIFVASPIWGVVASPITILLEKLYHMVLRRPIEAGWIRY